MDIRLFLDSIAEHIPLSTSTSSLSAYIYNDFEHFPRWKDVDIALIGVHEQRGSDSDFSEKIPANVVRKALYQLKKGQNCRIVDLGNLRLGDSVDQSYGRLSEVCAFLLQNNVVPFILGGSNDLAIGQYTAYENMEKMVYPLIVDHKIDIDTKQAAPANDYISNILLHQPNYLFGCGILGYQSYLSSQENIKTFQKLNFDELSIGMMRRSMQQVEPLFRTADMLSFDMTALRKSDAHANQNSTPFGLSCEEACQIAWYAGQSENLSSFGIYEYNPDLDQSLDTVHVIAVMIWYFIEGFSYRKQHPNFSDSFYSKYLVSCLGYELVFYKATFSEKWWVELPQLQNRMACSYEDYQKACQGELPERLFRILAN